MKLHPFYRGKIAVTPKCIIRDVNDFAIWYTPGVAEPCKDINKNPEQVFQHTNKANMVAVISDGSRVLGLGDIGPEAALPVMEGKAILFKYLGGVDAFPICLDTKDPEEIIRTVLLLQPTFGGINLEDITAPKCFEIEEKLQEMLDIPVFHDDQHGTAIIIAAGLENALQLQDKKMDQVRIVCLGAGAAGIASMKLLHALGAPKENLMMIDRNGVIHSKRTDINKYKQEFAVETELRTLTDAMNGADVFIGVSGPDLLSKDMLASMAERPVIFALSNPDPEILPELAHITRDDLIMATGRSDYPNQINNVLGFPYIFRGALDVRASKITQEMLVACVHALSALTHEPVPKKVLEAYNLEHLEFGPEYIIPKPLDPRLLERIPKAIAEAAIESGVARLELSK
ncbi:MAG: malate dehydrogenase [Gammaproteobacteria bacterium]|nr:malate dehydrogenase [Gammaproteobacteria bacterium]